MVEPLVVYDPARVDGGGSLGAAIRALEARAHALELGVPRRVEGVTLGGCVDAIGTGRKGAMRRQGHAHTAAKAKHRGWICIAGWSTGKVLTSTGKPTRLLVHEVAHIMTMTGHDAFWRRMVADLGAPSEARGYERPRRMRCAG